MSAHELKTVDHIGFQISNGIMGTLAGSTLKWYHHATTVLYIDGFYRAHRGEMCGEQTVRVFFPKNVYIFHPKNHWTLL